MDDDLEHDEDTISVPADSTETDPKYMQQSLKLGHLSRIDERKGKGRRQSSRYNSETYPGPSGMRQIRPLPTSGRNLPSSSSNIAPYDLNPLRQSPRISNSPMNQMPSPSLRRVNSDTADPSITAAVRIGSPYMPRSRPQSVSPSPSPPPPLLVTITHNKLLIEGVDAQDIVEVAEMTAALQKKLQSIAARSSQATQTSSLPSTPSGTGPRVHQSPQARIGVVGEPRREQPSMPPLNLMALDARAEDESRRITPRRTEGGNSARSHVTPIVPGHQRHDSFASSISYSGQSGEVGEYAESTRDSVIAPIFDRRGNEHSAYSPHSSVPQSPSVTLLQFSHDPMMDDGEHAERPRPDVVTAHTHTGEVHGATSPPNSAHAFKLNTERGAFLSLARASTQVPEQQQE